MSTRMLKEVLKGLIQNGFKAAVIANSDGLILASDFNEDMNDQIIGAMVALLSEAAEKAQEELELSTQMKEMRIKWEDLTIWARQTIIEGSAFLIAAITPPVKDYEIDKYQSDLMNWAEQNIQAPLKKLVSL